MNGKKILKKKVVLEKLKYELNKTMFGIWKYSTLYIAYHDNFSLHRIYFLSFLIKSLIFTFFMHDRVAVYTVYSYDFIIRAMDGPLRKGTWRPCRGGGGL
jgi:hypothetical protein